MINEWENQIIQGDCLELMKQLPDKSVDLVLTDPPYGLGKSIKGTIGAKRGKNNYSLYEDTEDTRLQVFTG